MFSLPRAFEQNLSEIYGQQAFRAWSAQLPDLLARCAERWQLQIASPFENLSFHFVAPAVRADGTRVILKTCSLTDEFEYAARALRLSNGRGMARLLEVDEQNEVMLLERLEPGTLLATLVPEHDDEATVILATVMQRIWQVAPPEHAFPTVQQWAQGLARLRTRYQGGSGPLPAYLVDQAEALFRELGASTETPMLLHGDLHHENVLLHGNEWYAIDPKGVVGAAGYETGALFYNPQPQLARIAERKKFLGRRIAILAEVLGMEREEIRGWALAQCVLSSCWAIEDADQSLPEETLASAEALASL